MQKDADHAFELRPPSDEEGGGWLITYPDLPGCMSDGETPEDAMANGKGALSAWIKAAELSGRDIPVPGELPSRPFA